MIGARARRTEDCAGADHTQGHDNGGKNRHLTRATYHERQPLQSVADAIAANNPLGSFASVAVLTARLTKSRLEP